MKQYRTVNNLVGWITFPDRRNGLLPDDRTDRKFLGLSRSLSLPAINWK